jgi:outer membrane protein OmpA-like peptidoglycan-associated protein
MKGFVSSAIVALALTACSGMTRADDAKPAEKPVAQAAPMQAAAAPPADSKTSSEQIIQQLTPPAAAPPLHFRGLHLLTSQPAATAQMPAVGLDIRFKTNSAELTEDTKALVKQLADAMKSEQLSKYHFLVEGHTDSVGKAEYNMSLSKRRAQAVKEYLVTAYGVPRTRLEAIGRGQTMPINASDPANPANRRVQVVNIGQ